MFIKVAVLSFLPILTSTTQTINASPPQSTPISICQCNTGEAQCCDTVQSASAPAASLITGLLGIVISGVDVLVGLGCTPITIIGLDQGAHCAQEPVCCENNNFNGLINIGCTPISL
ncbi:hypothetical protein M422DRAFT_176246 [Sphaerobolus stellatus SS14]|uniref:Hydrophobin n=1 Tax=Sphaerobolus stellatus (strain SS14) TaxID=990650 RepID=A0A0C9UUZ0_SPHS4|nr:hypothetical protein M422DRAFT_176246 [Sphaerobolus stellatus SS14]